MSSSPARRRYNRDMKVLAAIYAVLLLTAVYLFRDAPPRGVLAVMLALCPALPVVGMFAALGRYLVRERDEYLRVQTVRQALIASGVALTVATFWGFLESFGVAPRVGPAFIVVVWCVGMGIGQLVNRLVERRA